MHVTSLSSWRMLDNWRFKVMRKLWRVDAVVPWKRRRGAMLCSFLRKVDSREKDGAWHSQKLCDDKKMRRKIRKWFFCWFLNSIVVSCFAYKLWRQSINCILNSVEHVNFLENHDTHEGQTAITRLSANHWLYLSESPSHSHYKHLKVATTHGSARKKRSRTPPRQEREEIICFGALLMQKKTPIEFVMQCDWMKNILCIYFIRAHEATSLCYDL